MKAARTLRATIRNDGRTQFVVWAPRAERLLVELPERGVRRPMERDDDGYHTATADAPAGTLYWYAFEDGRTRPDPASLAQPRGVHGPSMVHAIDPQAPSPWKNPPIGGHVFYELHVGTFTPEGTFDAIIPRLHDLRELGVTAIELMPIGEFPGARNWGYDGVCLFAAQSTYGGLAGLRRLVDACHARGMGIILDVVYNHLGPEGNYLAEFGPYFTDRYKTPWGQALNFDGPDSDHVREFFIQNALHWTARCGVDGLRLDAVHAINDQTARPFLRDLRDRVHAAADAADRRVLLIAESHDNDPRLVRAPEIGGLGLDGAWNDDYHHAIRTALSGETKGYYRPYGAASQIAKCVRDRYVFAGEYSSGFRRRHGAPAPDLEHSRLVVFTQNHDQVGNRPMGDRLDASTGAHAARVAAMLVLLAPFTPMLWMGEEHAETAPFLYFVSHSDQELVEAVRRGRCAEFPELHDGAEPPDPQSEGVFEASKIDWRRRESGEGASRLSYYRRLLKARRAIGLGTAAEPCIAHAWDEQRCVALVYCAPPTAIVAANLGNDAQSVTMPLPRGAEGPWAVAIDSGSTEHGGAGRAAAVEALPTSMTITFPGRGAVLLLQESDKR